MKCAKCQTENEREAPVLQDVRYLDERMRGRGRFGARRGEARDARSCAGERACGRRGCRDHRNVLPAYRKRRRLRALPAQARRQGRAGEGRREVAALNAADHEVYRRRRRNCLVVGIVLVVLFAMMYPSWTGSLAVGVGEDPMRSLASHAVLFSLGAFNAFFFPFGFTPIKNFIVNNGFFVVAGWLFLALAALLLVMLSMLFGVPYAIWLSWKVRKSRKATEEAVEFAQMAELEYQHM